MSGCYCADTALQTAVAEVLESLGLESRPGDDRAVRTVAPTLGEQFERIALRSRVFELVRRLVPVSQDSRRLVYTLADAASRRRENARRRPPAAASLQPTLADVEAYAVAGGGCCGPFAEWLAARRGVPAMPPATDPRPRPPGPRAPRSPMPPASDPSPPRKTVRSSRWSGAGKAVRP